MLKIKTLEGVDDDDIEHQVREEPEVDQVDENDDQEERLTWQEDECAFMEKRPIEVEQAFRGRRRRRPRPRPRQLAKVGSCLARGGGGSGHGVSAAAVDDHDDDSIRPGGKAASAFAADRSKRRSSVIKPADQQPMPNWWWIRQGRFLLLLLPLLSQLLSSSSSSLSSSVDSHQRQLSSGHDGGPLERSLPLSSLSVLSPLDTDARTNGHLARAHNRILRRQTEADNRPDRGSQHASLDVGDELNQSSAYDTSININNNEIDVDNDINVSDNDSPAKSSGVNKQGVRRECEARYGQESSGNDPANSSSASASASEPAPASAADGEAKDRDSDGDDSGTGLSGANNNNNLRELEWYEVIFRYFVYALFTILFLIGTGTNTLVLYTVWRKKKVAPMDIYIIMLAINDLIYCLFALPVPPLYVLYYGEWVFGRFCCKMVAFFTSFSVHNSSMTVVNIAHLRFRMVVHPFEPKVSKEKALARTIVACFLAAIVTVPYVLVVNIYDDEACSRSCDEYWGPGEYGRWKRFLFSTATTVVQFLLPLLGFEYYYKPIRDQLILIEKTHCSAVPAPQQNQQLPPTVTIATTSKQAGGSRCSLQVAAALPASGHHPKRLHHQQLELCEMKPSSGVSPSGSAPALNHQFNSPPTPPRPPDRNINTCSTINTNPNPNTSSGSSNNIAGSGDATTTTTTGVHLHKQASSGGGGGVSCSERERIRRMHLLSRLKQTRKVVYFFSFTWLPLNVFNLIYIWADPTPLAVYTHLMVQAAACCGVCLNPVIYPLSNDNYRQEFQHILPICLIRKLDSLLKA